jgi:hypothetical protein
MWLYVILFLPMFMLIRQNYLSPFLGAALSAGLCKITGGDVWEQVNLAATVYLVSLFTTESDKPELGYGPIPQIPIRHSLILFGIGAFVIGPHELPFRLSWYGLCIIYIILVAAFKRTFDLAAMLTTVVPMGAALLLMRYLNTTEYPLLALGVLSAIGIPKILIGLGGHETQSGRAPGIEPAHYVFFCHEPIDARLDQ